MGLLNSQDKETIKRALPKNSNKIIDVTVARLYIAYPDPNEWTYTGLSGAIALVDDLVGNTFFLKLIDICGNNGVIWDQELYVNFQYYQDRTFFHSFEMDECYAGLLFIDINEAQHFLKRVQKREKYASRKTLTNKNAVELTKQVKKEQESHVVYGPRGEGLMGNQRQRYDYSNAERIPSTRKKAPPPPPPTAQPSATEAVAEPKSDGPMAKTSPIRHPSSPSAPSPSLKASSTPTSPPATEERKPVHKVPPLPAQFAQPPAQTLTQQLPVPSTPNSANPFPFPIPQQANNASSSTFPFPIPQSTSSLPPPLPQSARPVPLPQSARPVPLPQSARPVPQPLMGQRPVPLPPRQPGLGMPVNPGTPVPPPAPPSRRGPAPPPPPHRGTPSNLNTAAVTTTASSHNTSRRGPVPPPPPRAARPAMPLPGMLPQQQNYPPPPETTFSLAGSQQTTVPTVPPVAAQMAPQPTYQQQASPPPAPAMPTAAIPSAPPAPPMPASTTSSAAPPPPPPSFLTQPQASTGAPPPPPPPTIPQSSSGTFVETTGDAGRDALLASIRGAGGIKSLRKVDKSQLDRPSVLLQEAKGQSPSVTGTGNNSGSVGAGPAGPGASLADALAAALDKRKHRLGGAEDDAGDDW